MNQKSPCKAAMRGRLGAILLLLGVIGAWQGSVRAWGDGDGPTLNKTTVHIRLSQRSIYKPGGKVPDMKDTTCWAPVAQFDVRGPVSAGSECSVDFTKPDGSPWLHFALPTDEVGAGHKDSLKTPEEGDLDSVESKFTRAVGVFGFSIHLKNALDGTNQTLFSGKFTVGKVSESLGIPQMKNMYNFYVDHDWTLPIGYVWFDTKNDEKTPPLRLSMWFRGPANATTLEGHLFYQGKEIASTAVTGGSMNSEYEQNTVSDEKGDPKWVLWVCEWDMVRSIASDRYTGIFTLDKNPGDYEVKVLRDGKLSRDVKFTVGSDGKVVDTGIGDANKLGTNRVVVPVKVLGTLDGPWKATAWKTDAFYGNPLTGFTAP